MYEGCDIMPDIINWSNFFVLNDRVSDTHTARDTLRFLDSNPIPGRKGNVTERYREGIESRLTVLEQVCSSHEMPKNRRFWEVFQRF